MQQVNVLVAISQTTNRKFILGVFPNAFDCLDRGNIMHAVCGLIGTEYLDTTNFDWCINHLVSGKDVTYNGFEFKFELCNRYNN